MRIREIIVEFEHTAEPTPHGTFNGDPCTKPGCKGHIRGWQVARQRRITDPNQCRSNNQHRSFWKGCWDNAVRQRDGKWQIHPAIRKDGRFVKTNSEKYHQPKPEQKPEQNPIDKHTPGY
jgi:hypothetical protein